MNKKINNKGFAITSILYGLLIMLLLIVMGTLIVLANQKKAMEELIDGVNGARNIVNRSINDIDDMEEILPSTNDEMNLENIDNGEITVKVKDGMDGMKKYLQDLVVTTAKSYLSSQKYSDYDQHDMETGIYVSSIKKYVGTFKWRTLTMSPEDISRTNLYHIDCSSFVTSVYKNSLMFDFSNYYTKTYRSYLINDDFTYNNLNNDENRYIQAMSEVGLGPSTTMFNSIAKQYYNPGDSENSIVQYYFYSGDNNKCVTDGKVDELVEKLQTGDLVVYIHRGGQSGYGGHVMLYVENLFPEDSENKNGFIHATGYSYNVGEPNEDEYSVQVATMEDFYSRLKRNCKDDATPKNVKNEYNTSISILRPINDKLKSVTCDENNKCSVTVSKNAVSRKYLYNYGIEQYAKVGEPEAEELLGKYNSVKEGDRIRYILHLKSDGSEKFKNFVISATLPNGTRYISCGPTDICSRDNEKIVFNNIESNFEANEDIYYWYSVRVEEGSGQTQIINDGMEICRKDYDIGKKVCSQNITPLKLPKIVTNINNTFHEDESNTITDTIKFAISKNEYLKWNSSGTSYKYNLEELDAETGFSAQSFIRMIYYNAFDNNYDVSVLEKMNKTNTKNLLKEEHLENENGDTEDIRYIKLPRTNLSETVLNLENMLVPGLYGGRYLLGNITQDRTKYFTTNDLQVGDIIFYYYHTDGDIASLSSAYMYDKDTKGNPVFIKFISNNSSKNIKLYFPGKYNLTNRSLSNIVSYDINSNYKLKDYFGDNWDDYEDKYSTGEISSQELLKQLYAEDLFFVFRPSRVM